MSFYTVVTFFGLIGACFILIMILERYMVMSKTALYCRFRVRYQDKTDELRVYYDDRLLYDKSEIKQTIKELVQQLEQRGHRYIKVTCDLLNTTP